MNEEQGKKGKAMFGLDEVMIYILYPPDNEDSIAEILFDLQIFNSAQNNTAKT